MARYEISIEIVGLFSSDNWQLLYGDVITSTAVEHGAIEWQWIYRDWGIVCEIAFSNERQYERWRTVPGVIAAFDMVPDPVNGLIFHRGWGGTSGSGEPRRPRPLAGAGAAELEVDDEPEGPDDVLDRVSRVITITRDDVRNVASV